MKRKTIRMIPVITIAAFAAAGGVIAFKGIQDMQEAGSGCEAEAAYETEVSYGTDTASGCVTWNGKAYRYNDHRSNFLFLGVDKEELAETETGYLDAGQTDAVFLLSWDRVTEDMTVISIPRDTMTPYNFYGIEGQDLGRVKGHLTLAFSYGDGKHESCKLAVKAVSDLFYGLPIERYCAVSLEAMPETMKEIGPVTVTVPNESLESKYPQYREGTELTLNEDNIEPFIRYRDITVSQSALARLERQEVFLEAMAEKAEEKFREDPGVVTRVYEALKPYMVTNAGADEFAGLMERLAFKGKPVHWTVPGNGAEGEVFDEYHVDEDALYEKIIETFYIEEM